MINTPTEPTPIDRFMPKPEVLGVTGFSATTLWREIRAERFPPPVQLSPNRVGWPESQVRAWQHARVQAAQRVLPPPVPSPRQRKKALHLRDPGSYFGRGRDKPEAA